MNSLKKSCLNVYFSLWKKYILYKQRKKYNKYQNKLEIESLSKEEKEQVDQYYLEHYGRKITYFYHSVYKSMTGKFDVSYFPDHLYFSLFEPYMNSRTEICKAIEDKNFLSSLCQNWKVRSAKTVLGNIRGEFIDSKGCFITKKEAKQIVEEQPYKALFIKPSIETCGGVGCRILENEKGISFEELDDVLQEYSKDYIVQEVCKNHESLRKVYPNSVNTFRVVTYIFNHEVKYSKGVMRVGCNGARIDNASSGGIFLGIQNDGSLLDYAMYDFDNTTKIYEHPNTKLVFKGYKIENYPKVIEKAVELHKNIAQIGVINWDFTLDEDGEPLLIEANVNGGGGIELIQWSHGEGIFKEDMKDILRWLSIVEKKSKMQYLEKDIFPEKGE